MISQVRALGFDALLSDDGSTDNTILQAKSSGAEILTATQNQGKGAALRRGFDWFLEKNYTWLIVMDADGQHNPSELSQFLKKINENNSELIIGNRMQNPLGMPFVRRATNRILSHIISCIAKQTIPDSQCGYRAIKKEALRKLKLHTSHFEIESEILLEAAAAGCHISSITIGSVYEGAESKISPLRDTMRFFKFIFSYLFKRRS